MEFRRYIHCKLTTSLQRIEIADLFEKSQCGWTTCLRSTMYIAHYDVESANARLHLYGENPVFVPRPVPAFLSGFISSPEDVVPMIDAVLTPAKIQFTYESDEQQDALVDAIHRKDLTEIKRLLEAGADPNRGGLGESFALDAAVGRDETGIIIRTLVAAGADVNIRDEYGQTPLHTAVNLAIDAATQGDYPEIDWREAGLLLDLGADPMIRDDQGQSAYDWISEADHSAKEDLDDFLKNRHGSESSSIDRVFTPPQDRRN